MEIGRFVLQRQCTKWIHLATAVVVCEVVHDDGNGQCDDQDPAEAADDGHRLPESRFRTHAVVAGDCHGDHSYTCPPERLGDWFELGILDVLLCEVGHGGEDDNADVQEEHQQTEFLRAVTKSEAWGENLCFLATVCFILTTCDLKKLNINDFYIDFFL